MCFENPIHRVLFNSPEIHFRGGRSLEVNAAFIDLIFNLTTLPTAPVTDRLGAKKENSYCFKLYRGQNNDFNATAQIAWISAQGSIAGGAEYRYLDTDAIAGQPDWYWLVDVDNEGVETVHGPAASVFGLSTRQP